MNLKGHDSVSGNERIVVTEIDKRREWERTRENEKEWRQMREKERERVRD
jgi:hypothetical protein